MDASSSNNKTATTVLSGFGPSNYCFIPSSLASLPPDRSYDIKIRQQPQLARVCSPFEKDRRCPVDPPPILQLEWLNCSQDIACNSPFYFSMANLLYADEPFRLLPSKDFLCGSTVSSIHRLRDVDNNDAGFFVFGDLVVLRAGYYRLHFSLFEIVEGTVQNRKTVLSDPFVAHTPKLFPGTIESTFLSRTFSDQGVKIRIRKRNDMAYPRKRKTHELDINQDTPRSTSLSQSQRYHHQLQPNMEDRPHQPQQQQLTHQQTLHYEPHRKIPPLMLPSPPYAVSSPPPIEPCKLPSFRAIIDGYVHNNERSLPPLMPRQL